PWTGRSPRLLTSIRTVGRPSLISIGVLDSRYSPGIMLTRDVEWDSGLSDRLVNGDELGSVGERPLDLDLADHLRHSVHDGVGGQQARSKGHDLCNRSTVADHFENLGG